MTRFKRILILVGISLSTLSTISAQNFPSFEELERQVQEMQLRMMQQMQQLQQRNPFNNPGFAIPDSKDTSFTFRFDTTFTDGGTHQFFFRSSPMGDSTLIRQFFGNDPFFQDFFGFGNQNNQQYQKDDGNHPSEDGLLPEERLQSEEDFKKNPGNSKPAPSVKPAPKKPVIKTIRV